MGRMGAMKLGENSLVSKQKRFHRNRLGAAKEQSFIEMEEVHRNNRVSESILKSAAAK
jgi:hypothetical protein